MSTYDPLKKHDWLDSMTLEHPVSWTCGDCGAVARSSGMKMFLDDAPCVREEPTAGGFTFPELVEAAAAAGCSDLSSTFELDGRWFTVDGTTGDVGQPKFYAVTVFSCGDERVGRHEHSNWLVAVKMRGIAETKDAERDASSSSE